MALECGLVGIVRRERYALVIIVTCEVFWGCLRSSDVELVMVARELRCM